MFPKLVVIVFAIFFLILSWQIFSYQRGMRTRWVEDKLALVRRELGKLLCLAGEMAPSTWKKIVEIVESRPSMRLEVLAGPWIIIEDKYAHYLDSRGKLLDPHTIWEIHPLFGFLKRTKFSGRVRVFMKARPLNTEKHFGIGIGSGEVFIEHHHGRGPFAGGIYYKDNEEVFRIKVDEFEQLKNDLGLCIELKEDNVESVLSMEMVEFCLEKDRPRKRVRLAS